LLGPLTQRRVLKRVFQHGTPEFLLPHPPRIPHRPISSRSQRADTCLTPCILPIHRSGLTGYRVSFLILCNVPSIRRLRCELLSWVWESWGGRWPPI
jgi:hypothetical protein